MKKFVLSIGLLFLFLFLNSQTLNQAISYTFDDNNPILPGNQIYEARDFILFQPHSAYVPSQGNSLTARINPYLLFPPPPEDSLGGPNPGDIGVVGTLPGVLDVSLSGAATYTIPFDLPQGIGSMNPNLSINYNSQGGDGLLGIKFSLGGLSSISRTSTDFYHDGSDYGVQGVHFNQFDQFLLDGQRLINITGLWYGEDGAEYRTEIQSFQKVISHGVAGNGPQWFEVWTKEGKNIEYGNTTDSRIELPGHSDVLMWMISKISDRQGNYISFEYNETEEMTCSPKKIIYTGNNSSNPAISPFYSVEFEYENRLDVIKSYVSGAEINTKTRLKDVVIKYIPTSTVYKKYSLTYNNDASTLIGSIDDYHSRLMSVNVSDAIGTSLNSTKFSWGEHPESYESYQVIDGMVYNSTYPGDFNGDGKTDLIKVSRSMVGGEITGWDLWLANTDGTGFVKTFYGRSYPEGCSGCQDYVVGDFNGDGLSDLIEIYDNYWDSSPHNHFTLYLAKNGVNGFEGFYPPQTLSNFNIAQDYRFRNVEAADFNGDGLDDIVFTQTYKDMQGSNDCQIRIASFDAATNQVQFNESQDLGNSVTSFVVGHFYDQLKYDLMLLKGPTGYFYSWDEFEGKFILKYNYDFPSPELGKKFYPADINGDGLTDLLTCFLFGGGNVGGWWSLFEIKGTSVFELVNNVNFLTEYATEPASVLISDCNSDGYADIVKLSKQYNEIQIYSSLGNGQFTSPEIIPNNFSNSWAGFSWANNTNPAPIDVNGDGIGDVLVTFNTVSADDLILIHPHDKSNMVKTITNGLGKKDKIEYETLAETSHYLKYNTNYSSSSSMVIDLQNALNVVTSIGMDNGYYYNDKKFAYEGAISHRLSKEFLGFAKTSVHDEATDILTQKFNEYLLTDETQSVRSTFYFPHLVKTKSYVYNSTNLLLINVTDYIYKAFQYYPFDGTANFIKEKIMLPYLIKSNSRSWEISGAPLIKTARTSIDYDASDLKYGNPTKTTSLSDPANIDIGTSDDQFTYSEAVDLKYNTYDETNWIIGAVKQSKTTTFIKNQGSQTKETQYFYYLVGDARSQLLSMVIKEPGTDPCSLVTEFDYYPNGNLLSKLLSAPNADPPLPNRLMKFDYDPVYQSRFLTKTTDPLNHTTQATFDNLTGRMTSNNDLNNLQTTFTNSVFGTYSQSQAPDGTKNLKVLRWAKPNTGTAPTDATYYSWEQTSSNGEEVVYYDRLCRVLRTVTKAFNDNPVFVDHVYDSYGRPTKISNPYYAGDVPFFTECVYNNIFPRVDSKILPDLSHLDYDYNGLTTKTTNSAGQTTIQKNNVINLPDECTDAKSNTVKFGYSYNGNDLFTTSEILGKPETRTTVQIDKFGNRVNITDPSCGTVHETYNAFGELISKKDQKQTELTKTLYSYDLIGRISTRKENGQITTWTYDNKPVGVGSPDKISNDDNVIEYFYDALSRPVEKDESIPGDNNEKIVYSYKYNYDSYSRQLEQTYPSKIIIRNHYSTNGYLDKITEVDNGTKPLWETTAINVEDQLTNAKIGNVINTVYSYHPRNGNLLSIQSDANGDALQDLEYQWDNIGNLICRKKWLDPQHTINLSESFHYDILNRMDIAILQTTDSRVFTTNFNYDDLGNITDKPPLTNMSYGASSSGPYAVTSANFTGDAIPSNTQDITYTAFDKINTISEGGSTLAITYGVNHERIKQIVLKNGDPYISKVYIGGLCEKITDDKGTRFNNFINGPKGLFAIVVKQDDRQAKINYILNDHLGSLNCITDNTGQLLEELSFDPWGRRRNPTDWTFDETPTIFLFDRGFTGHEHLDLFELINMNGRAYDPVVGRFLSADIAVQEPNNSQNYNRYSYVLNNPMKYTDPEGEWINFVIGGIVGGFTGWQIGQYVGAKGWDMFGYIVAGAAIGVISSGVASEIGGGAILSGAAGGVISGVGFSGMASNWNGDAMLRGGIYGGISGGIGGGLGAAIGGGWGSLAGGTASNLTSQLLYNNGDLNKVNWASVGLSAATSYGIYHANSFYNWEWGGGKNFGGVEIKYSTYNKLNATFTRSRFWRREYGGWILKDGSFEKLEGAIYSKTHINLSDVSSPDNVAYLVHTHYASEGWLINESGESYVAEPYHPSDPDYNAVNHFNTDGMILTNRSVIQYQGNGNYNNDWSYPLIRYTPLFWWFLGK